MSAKKGKSLSARAVTAGVIAGIVSQLVLSAIYAMVLMKGRGEPESARLVMYAIAFISAVMCGAVSVNSRGGTKLASLIAGLSIVAAAILTAVIISADDISAGSLAVIFLIFTVASTIGAMLKLGKSNKKIQRKRNKKK